MVASYVSADVVYVGGADMDALSEIFAAKKPGDIFPADPVEGKRTYLKLVKRVHPDMLTGADKQRGAEAFSKLVEMYKSYVSGDISSAAPKKAKTSNPVFNVTVGSSTFSSLKNPASSSGDAAFLRYRGTSAGVNSVLWVPSSVNDNDLLDAGVANLEKVNKDKSASVFFPKVTSHGMDVFGDGRHSYLMSGVDLDWFSLAEVKESIGELDGRNLAWIFKRMLVALSATDNAGIVHGAPTLDNFFIHPVHHTLVLDGWQYSVSQGDKMKAVPAHNRDLYPEYVFDKETVNYKTDIVVAAGAALSLLDELSSPRLASFFAGCVKAPASARTLLNELTELLFEIYGEPKYVSFKM